jgi:hypothetical protein
MPEKNVRSAHREKARRNGSFSVDMDNLGVLISASHFIGKANRFAFGLA